MGRKALTVLVGVLIMTATHVLAYSAGFDRGVTRLGGSSILGVDPAATAEREPPSAISLAEVSKWCKNLCGDDLIQYQDSVIYWGRKMDFDIPSGVKFVILLTDGVIGSGPIKLREVRQGTFLILPEQKDSRNTKEAPMAKHN